MNQNANLNDLMRRGFKDSDDGEDQFDAVIGAFAMALVVLGHHDPGIAMVDPAVTVVEGWILGRDAQSAQPIGSTTTGQPS